MSLYTCMQTFIHTADYSNFKIEYVYEQTSLFSLLYILKCRKGAFYGYAINSPDLNHLTKKLRPAIFIVI